MLKKVFGKKPRNAIEAIETSKLGDMAALRDFIDKGGKFSIGVVYKKMTGGELAYIAKNIGLEGMEFYFENGGAVSQSARTRNGWSEIIVIAKFVGLEGLKLYMERGGRFSINAVTKQGYSEAMMIVEKCGAEGIKFFVDHGGTFKWDRKIGRGRSERDFVIGAKEKEEALKEDPAKQFVDDIKSGAVVPVKKTDLYMK